MSQKKIHPIVLEARDQLRQGKMSRRDFLRISALLGLSVTGAGALLKASTGSVSAAPVSAFASTFMAADAPIRGGVLKAATRVERVDHPARFSLVSQSHPWRHVFDYLTYVDANGVAKPYLLKSWEASDDLLTWTLHLNEGIKFNNGKELTADDVLFNFRQWMDVDVGSSLLGALSYMDPEGQEKVDDYTIVCNLKSPSIVLPYHLFHYASCILPAEFEGDITRQPVGTGAFTVEEYVPGERCRLKRREDYWRMGADDKPLPYLDEIIFVQLGDDPSADLAALQTGDVDTIIEPPVTVWEAVQGNDQFAVTSTPTAASRVLRVRVDQDPWTDNKVRQALKYCHNREKILAIALRNQGTIGNDSHVAPAMADFCPDVEPYPFDTAKAKQLLEEAGYPNGVDVTLTVANEWPESMAYAEVLKQDAMEAGFNITLNPMPASQYWDGWTEFNMGITWWSHRPLAPMMLALAYTRDSEGNPVPWNESKWLDDEFEDLLHKAEGTLDLEERRELMCQIEMIMKERGSVFTPFFMNVWTIANKSVKGIVPSPEEFPIYHEAWKEA